jgi:hypothetical protein
VRILFLAAGLLFLAAGARASDPGTKFGSFVGALDLRMSSDGRTAVLLAPFAYIDPDGRKFETPTGWKVDGASIPWPLWSFIGSPWTGKYREASVIHDYLCDNKKVPWATVHWTFYTAMLANGVAEIQAKIMYVAVYRFGPRWDFDYKAACPNCLAVPYHVDSFTPSFDQKEFDSLKARIESGELSLDEARKESDASFNEQIKMQEIGKPVFIR